MAVKMMQRSYLKRGADVNTKNKDGDKVPMCSAEKNHI